MRQPTRPAARDGHPNGSEIPIRRIVLSALVALFVVLGPATASGWQPGEHAAQRHCQQGRVLSCIHRAALHYRQSYTYLKGVSWCESRWKPGATNGQYEGIFQFGPNAWSRSGYADHSPYEPKWAALGAARLFRAGHSYEWSCA